MSSTLAGPTSPTVRSLAGNRPLVLGPGAAAWRLVAGRARVFAVLPVVDDVASGGLSSAAEPAARRVPLFTLNEGDWAFPPTDDSARVLVLVALEDGTAAEPHASAGPEMARDVEAWAARLASAVRAPAPTDGHALPAAGPARLVAGDVVWPERGTAWVRFGPPALRPALFGQAGLPGGSEGALTIPVPAAAWLAMPSGGEVEVLAGADALASPAGWHGVRALGAAVLAGVAADVAASDSRRASALRSRADAELRATAGAYSRLAAAVDADRSGAALGDDLGSVPRALQSVAAAQGIELRAPRRTGDGEDPMESVCRASGVRWRSVTLQGRWWREDLGPLLVYVGDERRPAAVLPVRPGVVDLVDPEAGGRCRVDARTAERVGQDAVTLYRPLPPGQLSGRDVFAYLRASVGRDLWRLGAVGLLLGLLSVVTPLITKYIFANVVPAREGGMLVWMVGFLVLSAAGAFAFGAVQRLVLARIEGSSAHDLQSAVWDRVLDLPLPFFRRFSSGELANRVMAIDQVRQLITSGVVTSVLGLPVGLFSLGVAFWLNVRLALFGTAVLVAVGVLIYVLARAQARHLRKMTQASQRAFGLAVQIVDGVGKLRVAAAEKRAFFQWANRFADAKRSFVAGQRGFALLTSLTAAGTTVGTFALFLAAATLPGGALGGPTFLALDTAFAQALAAVVALSGFAVMLVHAKPLYDSARPVLEAVRETTVEKTDPGALQGRIEVSHVTFRYATDRPPVLRDLSLRVEPGQLVAVVGPSGAGKSSLLRMLLGFEAPEVGSLRYDGRDLDQLDLRGVRRQIGVVTQNVRLLPGDVLTNIIGRRPLGIDDAWAAAEIAGIADDIRAMPMGMHTVVVEGAGTFSGGQRQRLLIARAVAGRPRILLFDEATSALDNRTQAQVSAAIARLRATRVVIAHRLSTIRHADCILVLGGGSIVQAGTYDELVGRPGPFADLARRQLT